MHVILCINRTKKSFHVTIYKQARIWSKVRTVTEQKNYEHCCMNNWRSTTINYTSTENAVLSLCSMNIAKNHWVTFKCTVIVISLHFHQLQHGTQTRTACFCEGSTWNWHYQPASQGAWFLLDQVSRQFHPRKDTVHDQTKIITFSFWVGNWEQGEEHLRNYSLKCIQQFPINTSRPRATSLTNRQFGYTINEWKRYSIHEAEHSY